MGEGGVLPPSTAPCPKIKKRQVPKKLGFSKKIVSRNLGVPEVFEGFGGFRKLREACGKNFHLFSCKSTSVVTSYDRKTKNVKATTINM